MNHCEKVFAPPALVLPFADLGRESISIAGGKAANLGELTRAGFPVPPGFVLTTAAYDAVREAAGLGPLLEDMAHLPPSARDELVEKASRVREMILATPIPQDVALALAGAHRALAGGEATELAVRSSATAEDLALQSFAGQQDTYLGIRGEEALADAVRRCWASLWNDRAVAYRAAAGIDPRAVRLAVVVQRLVHARAAGVLFTANPITGRRGEMMVDAAPGLGEAVVSGAVVPDHYVIDARRMRVASRTTGERGQALTDEEALALAAIGARVEAHYGAPQDIEFAVDGEGRAWLVQSRPITTLFPLPESAPDPEKDLRVYASSSADEGVTRPITPAGLSAFRLMTGAFADAMWGARPADPLAGPAAAVEIAGRLYYDITPLVRSRPGRLVLQWALPRLDAPTAAVVRKLMEDPRLSPRPTSPFTVLHAVLGPLLGTHFLDRLLLAFMSPELARRAGRRDMDQAWNGAARGCADSPERRLDEVQALLFDTMRAIPVAWFAPPIAGAIAVAVASALLGARASEEDLLVALRALPHNPTSEMNIALWALGERVREDEASARALRESEPAELVKAFREGTLPPALREALGEFLSRWGHRAIAEVDLGLPRWAEDPTHLFAVIANHLRLENLEASPPAQLRRAEAEAQSKVVELVRRAGKLRGGLVQFFLGRGRELAGTREQWKDEVSRCFRRARGVLLSVGEHLVARGRLAAPEDIFFLSLAEARTALGGEDFRARVRARRDRYAEEMGRRRIPMILLSDGTDPEASTAPAAPKDARMLAGTAASPGKARGRARVLREPQGARIEPGEILVAPSTDPGWTPLFMTAGGLVMEKGGAISHGAVVAREYGIPAVVGVAGATERIVTGQEIDVDGAAGLVTILG
jgi:pyruvate,water dikinase